MTHPDPGLRNHAPPGTERLLSDSVWVGSVVVGDQAADGVVEAVGFPELPVVRCRRRARAGVA